MMWWLIWCIRGELAWTAAAGISFCVLHARSPWLRTPIGRQLMAMGLVGVGETSSLLALSFGVPVPPWVFAVGFGLAATVVTRWVVLRWKARRDVA